MKKIFNILKNTGVSLLKGALKEVPIVSGIIYNINESNESRPGKISYGQLIGQIIMVGLIIGVLTGKIDSSVITDYISDTNTIQVETTN